MIQPTVYRIYNTANDRSYVGSTVRPISRHRAHLRGLRRGTHSNRGLCVDWHRYGADKFQFHILEHPPEQNLRACEAAWIAKLRPRGVYNIAPVNIAPARLTPFRAWRRARRARVYAPPVTLPVARAAAVPHYGPFSEVVVPRWNPPVPVAPARLVYDPVGQVYRHQYVIGR